MWAHLDHQREEMLNRARHEQGEKLRVASRGPVPIRRRQDTELTAKLHIPAFSTQVEDTIEWSGEIGHVSFVLTAPVGQPRGPLTGSLVVYACVLRLARLEFILEVGASPLTLTVRSRANGVCERLPHRRRTIAPKCWRASKECRRILPILMFSSLRSPTTVENMETAAQAGDRRAYLFYYVSVPSC